MALAGAEETHHPPLPPWTQQCDDDGCKEQPAPPMSPGAGTVFLGRHGCARMRFHARCARFPPRQWRAPVEGSEDQRKHIEKHNANLAPTCENGFGEINGVRTGRSRAGRRMRSTQRRACHCRRPCFRQRFCIHCGLGASSGVQDGQVKNWNVEACVARLQVLPMTASTQPAAVRAMKATLNQ